MSYKLINYCEIEPNASRSYSRIHNVSEDLNLGDITKVDAKNIPDFNMLVGGSPCFVAGTKVYTSEGFKNIEDLKVGDLVLTHNNRFKAIVRIGHEDEKMIYDLRVMGSMPILATSEHPFLIVTKKPKKKVLTLSAPYKKKLQNINSTKDYLCSPILKTEENPFHLTEEYCFKLGKYLGANSSIRPKKKEHGLSEEEWNEISTMFDFGKDGYTREIPNEILNLPVSLLEKFLDGYYEVAGSYDEKMDTYSTVIKSTNLFLTLKAAIQKVYKVGCRLSSYEELINGTITCTVSFSKAKNKYLHYYVKDDYILYPVSSVKSKKIKKTVYNIEVEEDHTYSVQFNICYNCTDFSTAGQQKGSVWTCLDCGHKYNPIEQHYSKRDECPNCHSKNLEMTASSLIVEYLRILREKKPKVCFYENVKNLVSKKFEYTFNLFVKELEEYGYNVYYQVLNAKNYGIPQNRERVILVAIRKDVDNGKFKYPEPFDNGLRLKDMLATHIDDKFYIPREKTEKLLENLDEDKKQRLFESMHQINSLGLLDFRGNRQCRCVSGENGISPTLTTMGGGQQEPKILVSLDKPIELPVCCASRGRNPENPNSRVVGLPTKQRIEINENNTVNTLTSVQKDNWIIEPCVLRYERNEYGKKIRKEYEAGSINEKMGNMRNLQMREDGLSNTLTSVQKDNYVFNPSDFAIRKLIPLECFRLMGFTDEDFEKAKYYTAEEVEQLPQNKKYKKEISETGEERYVLLADTHAYKQAGNSIVVNVLFEVYKELYKAMPELFEDVHLVSLFSGIGAFEKALDMLEEWKKGNFMREEV